MHVKGSSDSFLLHPCCDFLSQGAGEMARCHVWFIVLKNVETDYSSLSLFLFKSQLKILVSHSEAC
jgi:hypothetical protein